VEQSLFISRAGADAPFAAEIGRILEESGYDVTLQQWDFANRNFMERMHAALARGSRVVALLSPEYLGSDHCQAEWQNALAGDPLNKTSRLILLRVVECQPVGLLSGLAYWDLVPIRDNPALLRGIVLDAVREERRETAASGPYWRAPETIVDPEAIRPVPGFSGRNEELDALDAALTGEDSIAVVYGLGGVGKSSIAREYAWRNRDRYSIVWWLNAQTEDGVIEGLLRLGALFTRGLDRLADRRAAAQQVTRSMLGCFAKQVLLIFDNLEDERLLRSWQPHSGARILVTSRKAAWSSDIRAVSLDVWPRDAAIGYLRGESGRVDLSESDAEAIVEALGALPLALSHAAAALRGMRMLTPERYLDHIAQHLANAPRHAEYPRSVFATFQTAVAGAEQQAPGAAALFCFAARFAPDTIPDELFRQSLDLYPEALRPVLTDAAPALDLRGALSATRVDEALGALDQLCLLSFAVTSRAYGMHRLVQLVGRDLIGDAKSAWNRCAVGIAEVVFPNLEFGNIEFAAWPRCERLLPHARAALEALPDDVESISAGRLADRCAVYLRERGDYSAPDALEKFALAVFENACGSEHPETVIALNNLAALRWRQARYEEAEALHARALAIREKVVGPAHPEVAYSLNGLAGVYWDQGRYDEAERLHARALAILEQTLGTNHCEVANTLNGLAAVYWDQGRYRDSEELHKRALAIREKALGPDHPDVANSLSNLAVVYGDQGRYEEAEPLHARAVAIREKALGPEHPYVALNLHNLASVLRDLGRYGEAEPLQVRALTIWEKTLGPDHRNVAYGLNGVAVLFEKQGRYQEAERLHKRALDIWEKTLGRDHPNVSRTLNDLALVYRDQGRYEEAEPLVTRALAIREGALGPDHPKVATILGDLAALYGAQGRFAEAKSAYARALAIHEKAFGPDHGSTQALREKLNALPPS